MINDDEKINNNELNLNNIKDISNDILLTIESETLQDNKKDKQKQKRIDKKNNVYLKTRMSNFVLKLSHFYGLMPSWKLMLITSGLAVAFGIIGVFLVKNPGIYNFGLAAIGQAISKLVIVLLRTNKSINVEISNLIDHALFWIMYLILSIPIFIFGWKKIGKKFTLLTIIFLIVSSLVSFGIGQIPGVNKLYIIGNFSHTEINENLKNYMIYEKWNNVDLWALIPLDWNKSGGNIIAQIILSIVYGVILAYFFAIIAIIGGSAGVTGIIGEYYSIFKQKNFGAINAYINLFIILGSVIIGNYLPASLLLKDIGSLPTDVKEIKNIFEQYQSSFGLNLNLSDSNYFEISKDIKYLKELSWKPSLYFSPNFVSTYICNIIFSILLDKLFPRYKLIQCKIYTHHTKEIKEKFNTDEKIVYSFSITKGTGGFSGRELDIITSITLYNHVPRIIYKVRQVDPKAFIAINNITNIDGSIYLPRSKRFSK